MIDRALLDKIRKCLALGRSANEHEAAAALAKARAIMEQHGITDSDLLLADIGEGTARAARNRRPPAWESVLAKCVCEALSVQCLLDYQGDRKFVGQCANAEIAGYAFSALFRQLKAARTAYIAERLRRCKPGRKRQRADVYCYAWALSVHEKVAALKPAPAPDALIEQYLAQHYPGLVQIISRRPQMKGRGIDGDILRGHLAGKAAELNAGVEGGSSPPRLLS